MTARFPTLLALAALALAGCGGSPATPAAVQGVPVQAAHSAARWIPAPGTTYQIQYDGTIDLSYPAQVYDLDMFDTPASMVAKLHAMGRKAVCYVDVGTWESWRPDAREFPKSVLGKPDGGWAGERWLDIRQTAILWPIMTKRLQLCKQKGFDGVDPDNLDGYENHTGFRLTFAEQFTYDKWVATQAHTVGLTVDQKGDNDMVSALNPYFDYAVLEQCWAQGWCGEFAVYTQRNALVVDVEYGVAKARFLSKTCPDTATFHETAILKKLSLNEWIVTCPASNAPRR